MNNEEKQQWQDMAVSLAHLAKQLSLSPSEAENALREAAKNKIKEESDGICYDCHCLMPPCGEADNQ